jgi:hypothetical protein
MSEENIELDEEPGVVFTIEAGKVVAVEAYPTRAEALEAVGVSG